MTTDKGVNVAKLPIKGVAQRKLEEALEKLKEQGKLKKKKKNEKSTDSSRKPDRT